MRLAAQTFPLRQLVACERGATLTEFAFVAPVLLLMVIGLFDIAHTQYTTALVRGAIQKSARDLTLESAGKKESEIDARLIEQVRTVVPKSATISIKKMSYYEFADVGESEEFSDDNNDGICNHGEPFVDANENGQWDPDRGATGIGGARDAVLYTVDVRYDRLFPTFGIAGLPDQVNLTTSTVLRNQPYDEQEISYGTGNCE